MHGRKQVYEAPYWTPNRRLSAFPDDLCGLAIKKVSFSWPYHKVVLRVAESKRRPQWIRHIYIATNNSKKKSETIFCSAFEDAKSRKKYKRDDFLKAADGEKDASEKSGRTIDELFASVRNKRANRSLCRSLFSFPRIETGKKIIKCKKRLLKFPRNFEAD